MRSGTAPDFFHQETLTGDWNGARTTWKNKGVDLASSLTQFYQGPRFVPDEILVPVELEDRDAREEYLSERKGKKIAILCPQRGDKRHLVQMAEENAKQSFAEVRRRHLCQTADL